MIIDIVAGALILVFMIIGFVRGILLSVLSIVSIVAAWFISKPLSVPVAERMLERWPDMSAGLAETIARLLVGGFVLLSLLIASGLIDKFVGRGKQGERLAWNRNLGAVAGLVFGGVLAFVLLSVADSAYKAAGTSEGFVARQMEDSYARDFVSEHNPADRLQITDVLKFVRYAQEHPDMVEELRRSPEWQEIAQDPKVQSVLQDRELMEDIAEASAERDVSRLREISQGEKLQAVLNDPELRRKLLSPALRERIAQIVAEKEQELAPEEETDGQDEEPPAGPEPETPADESAPDAEEARAPGAESWFGEMLEPAE